MAVQPANPTSTSLPRIAVKRPSRVGYARYSAAMPYLRSIPWSIIVREPISFRDCARSPICTLTCAEAETEAAKMPLRIIATRDSMIAPPGTSLGSDVHSGGGVPVEIIDQVRLRD